MVSVAFFKLDTAGIGNVRFRRMDGYTRLRVNCGIFLDVVRIGDRGGRSTIGRCCTCDRLRLLDAPS